MPVAAVPAVVAQQFTRVATPSQAAADSFAAAAAAVLESGSFRGGAADAASAWPMEPNFAPAVKPAATGGMKVVAAKLLASPVAIVGTASVAVLLIGGGLALARL